MTATRNSTEAVAAARIARLLDKRFKVVKRELYSMGFHRSRKRARRDSVLYKADGEDEGEWSAWIDTFSAALEDSLAPIVIGVADVESQYWRSRGARANPVDPNRIIRDYESREGRQIRGIGQDTQNATLKAISSWYNTDAGLPDLIDELGQFYDLSRAETIARTEGTSITSQVAYSMYDQFGVGYFNVDLADEDGDYPCDDCRAQAEGNPHPIGDQMPPYHPKDRCGTIPATESGGEFIYGGGLAQPTIDVPDEEYLPDVGGVGPGALGDPTEGADQATRAPITGRRPGPRDLPRSIINEPDPDEVQPGIGGVGIGALGETTRLDNGD